ncbi:hypothetical protein B0F90DRAFT_1671517 [Multifurca ochricompacta]|uniref:Uncharacterized protein n=1 Tax=Multifurca ochricompacta TaxID=376703 RepID=A0AAD4QHS6_9AGAM|nr:hypothetical protein B0F90DRAFT_1671517 [Multifurca ochricompacta]
MDVVELLNKETAGGNVGSAIGVRKVLQDVCGTKCLDTNQRQVTAEGNVLFMHFKPMHRLLQMLGKVVTGPRREHKRESDGSHGVGCQGKGCIIISLWLCQLLGFKDLLRHNLGRLKGFLNVIIDGLDQYTRSGGVMPSASYSQSI